TCNAPKGALTPELRAMLSAHKEAIKAHVLAAAAGAGRDQPGLVPVVRKPEMPLSDAQQRLWFFRQMDPSSAAYNMYGALRMCGRLNARSLENSFAKIIARHETLRTRFITVEGTPRAVVQAE